jgi:MFS family permease
MAESSIRYRGWLVVAACFAMTSCGFGFGFYGHSVYLAALTTGEGDAPRLAIGTVSTAVTVGYLAAAAIMVFISDLVARLGPRLFAAIGVATMGISLHLIAHIRSTTDLFLAYLAMAPAFAMLTNAAVANILGPWFGEKRGLAMSLALTGGGVGGLAIVPLLVWLGGRLSFASTLQLVAVVATPVLLAIVVVCVRRPAPHEVGQTMSGEAAEVMPTTRRSALRSLHYWTIAAPLMLAIMVQVGFVVHQVSFLSPTLGREGAGFAVFLTALMAAVSRIVVGFFIDRLDQRMVGALLLSAQASALVASLACAGPTVMLLASAVFGFAVGVMITLPALLIQREFPPAAFGMLSGLTLAIIQTGNALGPSLLGWLRDATGGYTAPLAVCIALELTAMALILIRLGPARVATQKHKA